MEYRMEHDSMGDVRVPADRYWGAQTQRSFENFPIGQGREPMPAGDHPRIRHPEKGGRHNERPPVPHGHDGRKMRRHLRRSR